MTSCPICLTIIQDDELDFEFNGCGHRLHYRCVSSKWPLACPMCRSEWSELDTTAVTFLAENFPEESTLLDDSTPQSTVAEINPQRCPEYVLPLCCNRLGPPPLFERTEVRSMEYIGITTPNGLVDSWLCYTCNKTLDSRDMPPRETWFQQCVCPFHGLQARVLDVQQSAGTLLGYTCFMNLNTYLWPINGCTGSALPQTPIDVDDGPTPIDVEDGTPDVGVSSSAGALPAAFSSQATDPDHGTSTILEDPIDGSSLATPASAGHRQPDMDSIDSIPANQAALSVEVDHVDMPEMDMDVDRDPDVALEMQLLREIIESHGFDV